MNDAHSNGKSFARDLKLQMAKISVMDWAPIDTKRIVLKLNLIKEHLSSAILSGCLAGVDFGKELVNLYSQEKVAPDANELIQVDNYNFEISDTSLHLAPEETQVLPPTSHYSDLYILDPLKQTSHIPSAMP